MRAKIDAYIEEHFEETIEKLKDLIRIPSKKADAKGDKPFGEPVHQALMYAENMLEDYGFITTNYDNYVVTADMNDKKYGLDILAHLDVVTEGEGWTVCPPFEPVIKDGKIYGRGTADDKGPAMAAILAMRAVKDSGVELKKGVRLILGTDEECGSSDLDYYYSKEKEAQMSFTPDAEFPVINTEKGRLSSKFDVEFEETVVDKMIVSLHSGAISNVVPAKADAVLKGCSVFELEKAVEVMKERELSFTIKENGELVHLHAEGVGGHAAYPELSSNALTGILAVLKELDLSSCKANDLIKGLAVLFPYGDYYGNAMGVAMKDEISGPLTLSLNVLDYEKGKLAGVFDCRAALCANDDNLTRVIEQNLDRLGLFMHEKSMIEPHHVSSDSFFVKTLLEVYEDHFGEKGEAHSTGGGTYVHHLKNGVAFGCEIAGIDNHMHGNDEFMDLEIFKKSAKIFADAIIRLCVE